MVKFKSLFEKSGLSLDRLRNFALIADAGGLSLAAGGDPGRMSLFSKQVRELEGFFGIALTIRQGRTVKLTEAGRELAQLARAHLTGLADFQQACCELPQSLSVGGSNSVLEWVLLPQMPRLRDQLPNVRLELCTGRTHELLRRLEDMTLDLALLREDAVVVPLRSKRVLVMTYSVFLPRRLVGEDQKAELGSILARVPLATSIGGQFRERLEASSSRAKWRLRIELSCASFTQAAKAVQTGAYGAVLPSVAAVEFAQQDILEFPLPFLKSYARPVGVVWNPRLVDVRPLVGRAVGVLQHVKGLYGEPGVAC